MSDKKKIYDNVLVYKLSCKNPSVLPFYIGSTTDLYKRIATHKHCCKVSTKERYLYKFINDFGGFENWKFDILSRQKNKTLEEKKTSEKAFIDMYNPQLNKTVIGRTRKEYQRDNREKIATFNSLSRYKHLEKRRKYLRERYQKNKEKYLPIIRKIMNDNKEKYKAVRQTRVPCLCGCNTTYQHRHNHRKTLNHKNKMIEITKEIKEICLKLRSTTKTKPQGLE
mgnify:CR=1 FL=1|tara:strand:- start:406 stop:1077 length:672 start_codon:yes stop_codon:yes gene_type:complete